MIEPADPYHRGLRRCGLAIMITVHAEAARISTARCRLIRSLGKKAGVSLNPATPGDA
jgi:ribulose-phosphate 3-epimerase